MTSNNCFGSAGFDGAGFASAEQQPGEMSSDEPPSRCIFEKFLSENSFPKKIFQKNIFCLKTSCAIFDKFRLFSVRRACAKYFHVSLFSCAGFAVLLLP